MNNMAKYRLAGRLNTTVSGKLLYLVLLDITETDNKVIVPQRRISEALGISRGTVSRNLRRLRDSGYIDVLSQYNDYGGRAPNKYVIQ
jgi:DNA-binding Lrp family transcriptional regulator